MAAQHPSYTPQPCAGTAGSMPAAYGAPGGPAPQLVAQTTQIGANVHVPHLAAPPASMQFNVPQLRANTFQVPPGGAVAPMPTGLPQQPASLTQGLPTPDSIQKQKEGYIKLLDEQLKQGQATLDQQRKQQTEYLHQQAKQQKDQVEMQIKQQVHQQETMLNQSYSQQMMVVQQASSQQKVALEQQAMQLTMEYQQKKSQEEMMQKQQQLQKEHVEAQMKFAAEMQKMQATHGVPQQPC